MIIQYVELSFLETSDRYQGRSNCLPDYILFGFQVEAPNITSDEITVGPVHKAEKTIEKKASRWCSLTP